VVIGATADSTPEPTANGTAVLFRTSRAPFDVAGQEWFANWDSGEVTVDVTAGTRRPAPPPPSYAPPKLSAVDGDQRHRRRMLQAVAAVLVPLVAVDFPLFFQGYILELEQPRKTAKIPQIFSDFYYE